MEKFKKWLFIGDLHGDFAAATKAYYWGINKKANIVYMGDLTDSYDKSKKEQLYCIQFVRNMLDYNAHCLWGNHDLSYINPTAFQCTGYSKSKAHMFTEPYRHLLHHENFVPFLYIQEHNVLATHAGFDPSLIPGHYPDEVHPFEILENYFVEDNATALTTRSKWTNFGKLSGGHGVGGLTWCRPGERTGALPYNIIQVAGHTNMDTCRFIEPDNTWYIDTLGIGDRSLLLLDENGTFNIIEEEQWETQEQ